MTISASSPFSVLTPDFVLDALDSVGIRGDGRLLALNSYENRVYQVGIEEAPSLVLKFYRPNRWSDAAILEEHAFIQELHDAEIPVVAALSVSGHTLHEFDGFRFTAFPMRGGRAPELDDPATREWIGRFIGRIHAIGALRPFEARRSLDPQSFGTEPREYLLSHDFIPPALLAAYSSVTSQALKGVTRCFDRAGAGTPLRLHGDCRIVVGCQATIVLESSCCGEGLKLLYTTVLSLIVSQSAWRSLIKKHEPRYH